MCLRPLRVADGGDAAKCEGAAGGQAPWSHSSAAMSGVRCTREGGGVGEVGERPRIWVGKSPAHGGARDQYSLASMIVRTRVVLVGSAGSSDPNSICAS